MSIHNLPPKVFCLTFGGKFNTYAIDAYKIIYLNRNMSEADKLVKLTEANNKFCSSVQPLFAGDNLKKWQGRRQFEFKRGLKQKKIIK